MATENVNLFEVASRRKLRIPYKGRLSVEDLWDLSVSDLDDVYKYLNAEAKTFQGESLLNTRSRDQEAVELCIEIVKYIFKVKQDEGAARAEARKNREKRQKILEIMENKQEDQLKGKSLEELQQMLDSME